MYGGGEFRQKRAHSPDTSYDNSGYRGPPSFRGGHPGHHFNKRHRGDGGYQPPQSLEDKITKLGETGSRSGDIGILAKEIDAELLNKAKEEENIELITTKICKCIVSFPTRIASYATLIGLISVKHYNVSCQIINTLHASYPVYLEAQKWQEALTIMHLLSTLVNCKVIRPSALLSQFELLLEIAQEDNIPQARSDYYVYTVLSSLPFVALELSAQTEPNNFEQILTTIETYLSKRSKDHIIVTRVWLSDDSTVQMDYLDSLWVQMKNFRANNWSEAFLYRPYNEKEYKDIMASSLIPQNSPTIQIPAHSPKYKYPGPKIVFRVFEDDVSEGHRSIPGSDKIERHCIESHIRNTIDEIPTDPRDCARHLCHMYGAHLLPIKHILIETILGELFTIPKPRHEVIVYHALLYEMAKLFGPPKNQSPEEVKYSYDVVLNEAVKVLYENLETMNVTCFTRFVEWFSFHLNNKEYLFPWQAWADATSKDKSSPKALFVQDLLDHCIRFSFRKKIYTLVSANLADLMPPEPTTSFKPIFRDHPNAAELIATINPLLGKDLKDLCMALNVIVDGVGLPEDFLPQEETHENKLMKIDIFTAVVLNKASQSVTHLSSAIGKFKNLLIALTRLVEDGQVQLLQTMHSCLEDHPQLQIILVDKLLKANLIEAKEVCNWIFSEPMKAYHLQALPWELLNITIYRALKAIDKLVDEKKEPAVEVKKEPGVDEDKDEGKNDDAPDGEDIEMKPDIESINKELGDKIAKARSDYDKLILQVFQMFTEMLGDHIRKCECANTSFMDSWFTRITGRMQEVYYRNYDSIQGKYEKLKAITDSIPSLGNTIVNLNQ